LMAWTAATALTLALMTAVPQGIAGAAVLAALAVAVGAALVNAADRRFWYLSEHA